MADHRDFLTLSSEAESGRLSEARGLSREAVWFLSGRSSPDGEVRRVPILGFPFLIGRGPNSALCLSCRTVSCRHAELLEDGDDLLVRDLGSRNGTYVNGERIGGPRTLFPDDLVQFGAMPFRVLKQTAPSNGCTICEDVMDHALMLVQFDRLMSEQAVIPNYQVIVDIRNGRVLAFEVLARSRLAGLEMPAAMFSVAAALGVETQLSRMIRSKAVQETSTRESPPHLFLNIHPAELQELALIDSIEEIRAASPAQRMTLEIHEKAVGNVADLSRLRDALHEMGVGLAFDDFGAGHGRLLELVEVRPDYVKFDISLIHRIHHAPSEQRRLVGSLVSVVRDMGVVPLAEGIECREEHDVCQELGFELAQGFYYGEPVPLQSFPHRVLQPSPAVV
jgi:EAL domain-containing protein (putative c-di-GMP-specific phosphodiesterase class I)